MNDVVEDKVLSCCGVMKKPDHNVYNISTRQYSV